MFHLLCLLLMLLPPRLAAQTSADPMDAVVLFGGGKTDAAAGFSVNPGFVVTCRHCVGAATKVPVTLRDGTKVMGSVVASDYKTELALVSVPCKLPTLAWGTAPKQGDPISVLGHPYNWGWTMSKGHVSALDRKIELPNGTELKGLLQLEFPINPGHSGAPVLGADGKVIGMVVARREDASCIGFAFTASTVQAWLKGLS